MLPWTRLEPLLAAAADADGLRQLLDGATRALGFRYYALVHHVDLARLPQGAVHLDNYPERYREQFIEQRYFADDPVHVACQRRSAAFLWTEVPEIVDLNGRQRAILASAAEAGVSGGLTVPVHVPGEFAGSCSFAAPRRRQASARQLPAVQYLSCFAFEAARRLAYERAGLRPHEVALSPRMLDCVTLVAQGKSDGVAAQLLGLSPETVREYVDGAKARLGVATRQQLVARALFGGLITYADIL